MQARLIKGIQKPRPEFETVGACLIMLHGISDAGATAHATAHATARCTQLITQLLTSSTCSVDATAHCMQAGDCVGWTEDCQASEVRD